MHVNTCVRIQTNDLWIKSSENSGHEYWCIHVYVHKRHYFAVVMYTYIRRCTSPTTSCEIYALFVPGTYIHTYWTYIHTYWMYIHNTRRIYIYIYIYTNTGCIYTKNIYTNSNLDNALFSENAPWSASFSSTRACMCEINIIIMRRKIFYA